MAKLETGELTNWLVGPAGIWGTLTRKDKERGLLFLERQGIHTMDDLLKSKEALNEFNSKSHTTLYGFVREHLKVLAKNLLEKQDDYLHDDLTKLLKGQVVLPLPAVAMYIPSYTGVGDKRDRQVALKNIQSALEHAKNVLEGDRSNSLSLHQAWAIAMYTKQGSFYDHLNSVLRKRTIFARFQRLVPYFVLLKSAYHQLPPHNEGPVFRGTAIDERDIREYAEAAQSENKYWFWTSVRGATDSLEVAKRFAQRAQDDAGGKDSGKARVIFELHNVTYYNISKYSFMKGEHEVMIGLDTEWEVNSISRKDDTVTITMTLKAVHEPIPRNPGFPLAFGCYQDLIKLIKETSTEPVATSNKESSATLQSKAIISSIKEYLSECFHFSKPPADEEIHLYRRAAKDFFNYYLSPWSVDEDGKLTHYDENSVDFHDQKVSSQCLQLETLMLNALHNLDHLRILFGVIYGRTSAVPLRERWQTLSELICKAEIVFVDKNKLAQPIISLSSLHVYIFGQPAHGGLSKVEGKTKEDLTDIFDERIAEMLLSGVSEDFDGGEEENVAKAWNYMIITSQQRASSGVSALAVATRQALAFSAGDFTFGGGPFALTSVSSMDGILVGASAVVGLCIHLFEYWRGDITLKQLAIKSFATACVATATIFGMVAGAATGAAIGAATGPAAIILCPLFAILGALLGSYLTAKLSQKLANWLKAWFTRHYDIEATFIQRRILYQKSLRVVLADSDGDFTNASKQCIREEIRKAKLQTHPDKMKQNLKRTPTEKEVEQASFKLAKILASEKIIKSYWASLHEALCDFGMQDLRATTELSDIRAREVEAKWEAHKERLSDEKKHVMELKRQWKEERKEERKGGGARVNDYDEDISSKSGPDDCTRDDIKALPKSKEQKFKIALHDYRADVRKTENAYHILLQQINLRPRWILSDWLDNPTAMAMESKFVPECVKKACRAKKVSQQPPPATAIEDSSA